MCTRTHLLAGALVVRRGTRTPVLPVPSFGGTPVNRSAVASCALTVGVAPYGEPCCTGTSIFVVGSPWSDPYRSSALDLFWVPEIRSCRSWYMYTVLRVSFILLFQLPPTFNSTGNFLGSETRPPATLLADIQPWECHVSSLETVARTIAGCSAVPEVLHLLGH